MYITSKRRLKEPAEEGGTIKGAIWWLIHRQHGFSTPRTWYSVSHATWMHYRRLNPCNRF